MRSTITHLLQHEFYATLSYYPVINRLPNIRPLINSYLEELADDMLASNLTTAMDCQHAKDHVAMLRMALISSIPHHISDVSDIDSTAIMDMAISKLGLVRPQLSLAA